MSPKALRRACIVLGVAIAALWFLDWFVGLQNLRTPWESRMDADRHRPSPR